MNAEMEKKMKIAFLMLAHKSPNQINMLLECLNDNDIDVYIHIDKKSNIKRDITNFSNNIYVNDNDRIDIKWGSVSMVQATINLIKAMIESNKTYDYVCLISGQDFLIKDIEDLKDFLHTNYGNNYIEILNKENANYYKYKKRVDLYYPQWMISKNKFIILLKFVYIIITGGFTKSISIFKRNKNYDLPFSFGSQWWTLQYDTVVEMYKLISQHTEYLKYYSNSLVPDESFFQTIFMMTSSSSQYVDSLTYTDWKEQINHPKTLQKEDIEILDGITDKFIARKFDENIDSDVIKYYHKKFNKNRGVYHD